MKYLKISELSEIVKNSLPFKTLKIIGEVSQIKSSQGNLFFNLKDKYASMKTIIWKSKLNKIENKLKDGDSVVLKGRLDYYQNNSTVSFIVIKIIRHNGVGELHKIYKETKKRYEKLGYFLSIKKIAIPIIIKNILLVTSETGAAIQDFFYGLKNNRSLVKYDILNVAVQGRNCPGNICKKLSLIQKNYDLIVITRGGGSFEDLFGFSKPELIEFVYNFKQPVLSAIGHQVDESLLDFVADAVSPTPSLAAQYIVDRNKKYLYNLRVIRDKYQKQLFNKEFEKSKNLSKLKKNLLNFRNNIINETKIIKERLWKILYNIPNQKIIKLGRLRNMLKSNYMIFPRIKLNYLEKFRSYINGYIIKLNDLKNLLDKKQDITLYSNNKIIKNPNILNKKIINNKNIKLVWNNFEYDIILKEPKIII